MTSWAEGTGPGVDVILCVVCSGPIDHDDRVLAQVWEDPGGEPCIAHFACLRDLGEFELGFTA